MTQVEEKIIPSVKFSFDAIGPKLRTSFAARAERIGRENNLATMSVTESMQSMYATKYSFILRGNPAAMEKTKAEIEAIVEAENNL